MDVAVEMSVVLVKKLTNDIKCSMVVETDEDRVRFQILKSWSSEWKMLFNMDKCPVIHAGKPTKYRWGGGELEVTDAEKDLCGVPRLPRMLEVSPTGIG